MSYEGYEIWLCKNGHRHAYDCYDTPLQEEWACDVPDCGEKLSWWEAVDETNFEGEPTTLKIKEEHRCTCKECGNEHHSKEVTFEIPTKSGHRFNQE